MRLINGESHEHVVRRRDITRYAQLGSRPKPEPRIVLWMTDKRDHRDTKRRGARNTRIQQRAPHSLSLMRWQNRYRAKCACLPFSFPFDLDITEQRVSKDCAIPNRNQ